MNKTAFDLYNCRSGILSDADGLYVACAGFIDALKLKPFYKPTVVPYFYGKNREDDGVSCFCMFDDGGSIGFFTLHTFSCRNAAYFDLVSGSTDENAALTYLVHLLEPGEIKRPSDSKAFRSFGLELKLTARAGSRLSADALYDLQSEILRAVGMTKITNTVLEKSGSSACLASLIAESHIAFIYDVETGTVFFDLFSCKSFDENAVLSMIEKSGLKVTFAETKARGIRHYDNVRAPSREELADIKSYLLCYGLAVDKSCYDYIVAQKPYVNEKGFVHAFNLNLYGNNVCVSTAEKFSGKSAFRLSYDNAAERFYISNDKYPYIPVNVFDDLPATGTVIDDVARPHSLTCVSLWPSLKCCFAQGDGKCKFCSIDDSDYDIIPAQEVADGIKKLFEKTYEYSLNIGGGTYKDPDGMVDYLVDITERVREFSNAAISCEIAPPRDLSRLEKLKRAGCDSLIVNLEIADDALRARICPAKHGITYEHYYETYRRGVEVFGAGKVSCVLIVGLQPDDDVIRECEKLVDIGVVPTLIPFKAMDNCAFRDRENCRPESLKKCAMALARLFAKRGLSPCAQLGCTKCGGCSLEVDYARMLGNVG